MAGIELILFVGQDGPRKRRVVLRSKNMRLLCLKAEEVMRSVHKEGHIAWLCTPPIIPGFTAEERIAVSQRVKGYLASVLLELDTEHLVAAAVTHPEGPVRSAA